jgi:hypothetical protein
MKILWRFSHEIRVGNESIFAVNCLIYGPYYPKPSHFTISRARKHRETFDIFDIWDTQRMRVNIIIRGLWPVRKEVNTNQNRRFQINNRKTKQKDYTAIKNIAS